MLTANKSQNLLLAKILNRTGSTATDLSASTYLSDGEIAVTDVSGTILNSTTVVGKDKIVLVQSQGSTKPPIKSDIIEKIKVTAYKGSAGNKAVEQVTYIGYDGTTSTLKIDPLNSNQYIGRILMQGEQNTFGNRDMYKQFDYTSDASATQAEIAEGIQLSLIANFDAARTKMPDRYAKFEVVNAATFTASTSATGTATYTYGSNVITTSGTTPATDFPAGSFVRIGTSATSTTTLPVYEVASVSNSGQTITLTVPYQGASGTGATTAFAFATVTTASAANFGVKLTGIAKSYKPGIFRYYKNRFKVLLINNEWGVTSVTYTTGASEGTGTSESIQDLEWLLQDGNRYRVQVPPFVERANAVNYLATASGLGFSIATLEYYNQDEGGISNTPASLKRAILGFSNDTMDGTTGHTSQQATGVVTSVITVLNAWIGTTPGPFVDITM